MKRCLFLALTKRNSLPSQPENERLPVLRGQLQRLVDDAVRHGDAQCGPARLDLVFAPLKQDLVVPGDALLLLVLRCDKPGQEKRLRDEPDAASPA